MGNPRFFNKVFTVDLRSRTEGAEIRYTLDGSEPTESSLMFEGPFQLDNDVTILARAFKDGFEPSPLMCVHAFPIEYLPAKNVAGLSPGCRFTYHQGEFKKAADVLASPVTNRGVMQTISAMFLPVTSIFLKMDSGSLPFGVMTEVSLRSTDA